ncbi:hypothetical protein, partial [Leptodesmis sp.]|uniref:hypothetical protein n=1 Tax=Leptodesmis sp. TaxID=3100501 RepID=UPI00405346C3
MTILHLSKSLFPILMGAVLVPITPAETVSAKMASLRLPLVNSEVQVAPTLRSPILLAQQSNFSSFFERNQPALPHPRVAGGG